MIKIPTINDLENLRDAALNFDIETKYWKELFTDKKVKYIQFGTIFEPREKYRFDIEDISSDVLEKFKEIYQTWSLIGSNLQFDIGQIYYTLGVLPKDIADDSYILARMVQEENQGLKKLVDKYFGVNKPDFEIGRASCRERV